MVDGVATYPRGAGGPSVLYLPGAGLVGLDFLTLAETPGAAHLPYDRGGTGWSDPAPLPRSAAEVARELDRVAGPGPHVLVGHSMGAVYARRFAQLFPASVAGMLLLDPGHEDLFAHLPAEAAALNDRMKPDPARLPDLTAEQREAVIAAYPRGSDFKHEMIEAFYQGMKHRPDSTFGTFNDDILAFKDPSFRRGDLCSIILGSQ